MYEGEYWNDKRHGYGTYKWPSGAVFTGQFRNDKKDGKGVFYSEHRETFEVSYHKLYTNMQSHVKILHDSVCNIHSINP